MLVTVTHANLAVPFRVCNNNVPVVSRGNTFEPFWFQFVLPDDSKERPTEMEFVLDGTMLPLIELMRAITTPAMMLVELVAATRPDTVELSVEDLAMRYVTWTGQDIHFRCVHEDIWHSRYPEGTYDPQLYAGIF